MSKIEKRAVKNQSERQDGASDEAALREVAGAERSSTQNSRRGGASGGQGFCVMLTGLSGAGKSVLTQALAELWTARGGEMIGVLDGDQTRETLCAGLGFSRADRDENVSRLSFVAAFAAGQGAGVAIAAICPYDAARQSARRAVEAKGALFCLAHVSTPLGVCESRDPKGLYKRARAGELSAFTGVSDPYETPLAADLVLDLSVMSPSEGAERIVGWLEARRGRPDKSEPAALTP